MTFHWRSLTVVLILTIACFEAAALGQQAGKGRTPPADWPSHNRDERNTRYSPLTEIDASNASGMAMRWSFQAPAGINIAATTPLVVQGVMYFNSGSQLFALDAASGKQLWMFQADQPFRGSGRGPVYGDGRIYAFGSSTLYAVDARTGKLVESFGKGGLLPIVNDALRLKYPGKYSAELDPTTLGYSMTTPPAYYNGMLYLGMPFSDSLLPGGLVVAVDAATGTI